ncbi:Rne/Rng family ribonuclease [Aliiroseovarius lamellibrachiae]|uniref:Rne/Rng family ribonuclease n=1 Tax=Aliiroseovarius lamellibrachiae TaxID=1924933 RepID=UPI001BE0E26C|nr:ribonuclease E/G [Aliiroseovarius lamellibrachiae]MBT2130984.1 Rne/Rng family ribonuclease [Aliiroseovarius lamellibrachiae]
MAKKMLIDATHTEETRVVVVDGNKVEEFDFESENKRQLAGNIYLAKVTRVEPSLQAAFVDYGGNRHGFLAFSEIHPDYYQIPVADREALMEEERAYAEAMAAEEEKPKKSRRRRSRGRSKAEETKTDDVVATKEVDAADAAKPATDGNVGGMDVIDLDQGGDDTLEGHSPMDLVEDTPVAEPAADAADGDAAQAEASTEDAPENVTENVAEAPAEAAAAEETSEEAAKDTASDADTDKSDDDDHDHDHDGDDEDSPLEADEKDDQIERVADDDSSDDIRPRRKPRPKRYKIQEVVKVRQILLVQVVKEERGNKGAALTTYLSLAGRYCVLMPNTARGGGISRKITNAVDRKKLKDIATEIDVPQGAGLIVRTAGAKRTRTEIKRDYEYLQRLWEQIRSFTLESIAPAKIYEEGNLIKRTIRDLYSREIDEVFVEGEAGYRTAKDFMKMIMPSHAKNVKLYQDQMPLFARYQVESYLSGMFNPTVQLKSGGYIVIGITEALVAIDVNSGRSTREGSIEDTAVKTNLEAADEVARQLRLRDLAGLIVIDFIDMDERRNNNAVEKRMKDKLKTDRARIQVGRISGFGLMEMSRQRLRPGMIEATTQPCNHCHGTGLIRSDDNLALNILRQLEEEGVRRRSREVLVKAPIGIVNFLMNNKREHIAQIEARYGMSVRIEADPFLVSPDYAIEKFKTATRVVAEVAAPVVSADASLMADLDEVEEAEVIEEATPVDAASEDEQKPKKRRRRRRRRRGGNGENGENGEGTEGGETTEGASAEGSDAGTNTADTPSETSNEGAEASADAPAEVDAATDTVEEKPKKTPRKRAPRKKKSDVAAEAVTDGAETAEATPEAKAADAPTEGGTEAASEEKPKKAPRKRAPRKKKTEETVEAAASDAPTEATAEAAPAETAEEEKPKKAPRKRAPRKKKVEPVAEEVTADPVAPVAAEPAPAPTAEPAPEAKPEAKPEPEMAAAAPAPAPAAAEAAAEAPKADDGPPKPKRKGWWSLGR